MDRVDPTELVLILAGVLALAAYVAFIFVPAVVSCGRIWERMAAGFLSLYILASVVGAGAILGPTILWYYDRYA